MPAHNGPPPQMLDLAQTVFASGPLPPTFTPLEAQPNQPPTRLDYAALKAGVGILLFGPRADLARETFAPDRDYLTVAGALRTRIEAAKLLRNAARQIGNRLTGAIERVSPRDVAGHQEFLGGLIVARVHSQADYLTYWAQPGWQGLRSDESPLQTMVAGGLAVTDLATLGLAETKPQWPASIEAATADRTGKRQRPGVVRN